MLLPYHLHKWIPEGWIECTVNDHVGWRIQHQEQMTEKEKEILIISTFLKQVFVWVWAPCSAHPYQASTQTIQYLLQTISNAIPAPIRLYFSIKCFRILNNVNQIFCQKNSVAVENVLAVTSFPLGSGQWFGHPSYKTT